ncbi:non-hydrolyzing UDP-N-acetylglucosamine 2-epimerase [Bdellovibrio bacteriovorus]|uniref:non-hydrolyzing UDP-N-acetylglucosamine 2-epimerase n=1 Tax=Bdellovibrio bacteriovorus TaxID=959 RepID=UPI003AA913B1
MSKGTVLTVVGARPQFVKSAVVSRAFSMQGQLTEKIIHTGQHFDDNMSRIFFDELNIPEPVWHLGIGGGSHAQNTGRAMEAIEKIILEEKPEFVLVYGDTDSTLAGALAAAKANVPLAHVEAGLRSFNRVMPEEVNRVLTDHVSTLLFTPSEVATKNLANEGIKGEQVINVGDVMYDAALIFGKIAEQKSSILKSLKLEPKGFVLATLHRKENTDNFSRLNGILAGLGTSERVVVLPLHPRTKNRILESGIVVPKNVMVIDPVGYLDMLMLERNAFMVATDSGGVQKEAYFQGVPCVTLRDETEWVELVELGVNKLVGASAAAIQDALKVSRFPDVALNMYGNGDSSMRIVEAVERSIDRRRASEK